MANRKEDLRTSPMEIEIGLAAIDTIATVGAIEGVIFGASALGLTTPEIRNEIRRVYYPIAFGVQAARNMILYRDIEKAANAVKSFAKRFKNPLPGSQAINL